VDGVILSPTDFVALLNHTLEFAYPNVTIEGELANFRVVKNRWVYFSLKDEVSSVDFFGTVYQLPGPLKDGLMVRAVGAPRMHTRFGFAVNLSSLTPVGEGSIKKAADLVRLKLQKEGLFDPARKRPLPSYPQHIGLITAAASAAYADFIKILGQRFGGLKIDVVDVYVQGDQAPTTIVRAVEHFNQMANPPEVLVITRGGGSAEDLAAFNDERVVRAVAASRILTLVAIGHETDESLAELAADARANTPTGAAARLVPDKVHELINLSANKVELVRLSRQLFDDAAASLSRDREGLDLQVARLFEVESQRLATNRRLVGLFDPKDALRRGYALVRKNGRLVKSAQQIKPKDKLSIDFADGKINAESI